MHIANIFPIGDRLLEGTYIAQWDFNLCNVQKSKLIHCGLSGMFPQIIRPMLQQTKLFVEECLANNETRIFGMVHVAYIYETMKFGGTAQQCNW